MNSISNKKLTENIPRDNEFEILKEFCDILKTLKDLTVSLKWKQILHHFNDFPKCVLSNKGTITNIRLNNVEAIHLKDRLKESLETRFSYVLTSI